MRAGAACVLALLLGACQSTSFESPPLVAEACDPALVGRWLSVGDTAGEDGEVELRLDAACRLEVDEHERSGTRRGDATIVRMGRHGRHRYLWVDAVWAQKRFEPEVEGRPGDVHVLRFAVAGDELTLHSTDDVAIAHAIIDGDIPGEVRRFDGRLQNRITGAANPAVLDRRGFFDRDRIRFRRAAGEAP